MFDKVLKAFGLLKNDVDALRADVEKLQNAGPITVEGKPGKPGKDGVSPSVEEITKAVIAQLPQTEKIDIKAITDSVLAQVPKPRDGRDVSVSDVAAVVLAKIPKPKDGAPGKNGPDLETVVRQVKAQVQDGRPGKQGPRGPKGDKGDRGASVTDVQLNNNDLFVYIDGKKKKAGRVNVPAPMAPFNPGNAGGGGSARGIIPDPEPVTGQVKYTEVLRAFSPNDQNPVAVDTPLTIEYGPAQGTPSDPMSIDADGVISINKSGLYNVRFSVQYGRDTPTGTAWLYFRIIVAPDGVNFIQTGRTILVKLGSENEDLSFQSTAVVQLMAGWKAKTEIMRGSEGANNGGLRANTPAEGTWNASYSAEVIIQDITWEQT